MGMVKQNSSTDKLHSLKKQSTINAAEMEIPELMKKISTVSSIKHVFEDQFNQRNACDKLEGEEFIHCLMEEHKDLHDLDYIQKQRELTLDGFVAGQLKKVPSLQDIQVNYEFASGKHPGLCQTEPLLDELEMKKVVKFKF